MKKLFLISALAASCAFAGNITQSCGNDTSKIEPTMFSFSLPNGETTSDIRQPFHLDRLECAFLSAGQFKLERIRGLENIPYISHRTNDGSVVDWEITSGTTFDNVREAFVGPIELRDGTWSDDTARSEFYSVRSDIGGGGFNVQFYSLATTDSQGRPGFTPCVYYSFSENALHFSGLDDRKDLWTRLGPPNLFTYDSWNGPYWSGPWTDPSRVAHYGPVVTEKVPWAVLTNVVSSSYADYAVTNEVRQSFDDDEYAAWAGVSRSQAYRMQDLGTNVVVTIVSTYGDYLRTNFVDRWTWRADGQSKPNPNEAVSSFSLPQTNSATEVVACAAPVSVVTNVTVTTDIPEWAPEHPGTAGRLYIMRKSGYANYTVVRHDVDREVDEVVHRYSGDIPASDITRWETLVFHALDIPGEIVVDASGTVKPMEYVRGHVVTNFAVWSTCSMTVTDTLVSTNAGTRLNVNLKDAIVLPKDVLKVSGSAMPTGHIIGIGRK